MEELVNYIDKGGLIFSLLLIMSGIGITLIFYKFFEINFFNGLEFKGFQEISDSSESLNDFKELLHTCSESGKKKFLDEVVTIIENNKNKTWKEEQIELLLQKYYNRSQRFMPTLEIISQVSPLIGLLGTVIGMIDSFNELELGGSLVDPSVLAGGIWTALLTTAMGLIVAIPALISHYFFDKKINTTLQASTIFINNLIVKFNGFEK